MTPETEERLREMRRMERRQTMGQLAIYAAGAFFLWQLEPSAGRLGVVAGGVATAGFAWLYGEVEALKRALRWRELQDAAHPPA